MPLSSSSPCNKGQTSCLSCLGRRRRKDEDQRKSMLSDKSPRARGCGLYNSIFNRRGFWHRRSSSTGVIPHVAARSESVFPENESASFSGGGLRRRNMSDGALPLAGAAPAGFPVKALPLAAKFKPIQASYPAASNGASYGRQRKESGKTPTGTDEILADLESLIYDHQSQNGSSILVRASSGNVMVHGNLGNLRWNNNWSQKPPPSRNVLDYPPNTEKEKPTEATKAAAQDFGRVKDSGLETKITISHHVSASNHMGNLVQTNRKTSRKLALSPLAPKLSKAESPKLGADNLKEKANEEYKKGNYEAALGLYDQAIAIDPKNPSYRSNKAAALAALGRILEAVRECREAIRIESSYKKAHFRLGHLYLRLGETKKAIHHFKQAKKVASSTDISTAQAAQAHLARSNEARKLQDYQTLLKESQSAFAAGVDSSPQVFAFQAEALLKLLRHDEADSVINAAPKYDIDEYTKFYGAVVNAYFLMVRALVDISAGRFEDAAAMAQKAAQLDQRSREIAFVVRRTRLVTSARAKGNDLFKAGSFAEAYAAYGEGLDHDSHNAILLCNRAACRAKLGQYENAIEDCNTALFVRPSYSKARLRRADCNAKLERWETAVIDYEMLIKELPGDQTVSNALSEAQEQLKKQKDEPVEGTAHS